MKNKSHRQSHNKHGTWRQGLVPSGTGPVLFLRSIDDVRLWNEILFFCFFHLFLLINQEQKQQIKLFNGIDGPISLPPSFSSSIPLHGQEWWWLLSKGHHFLKQSVRPIEGWMRNRPVLQVPCSLIFVIFSFFFFFLLFRMSLGAFFFILKHLWVVASRRELDAIQK